MLCIKYKLYHNFILKNLIKHILLYIFIEALPKILKEWFILNNIFQQQSSDARRDFSFDIHIGGGP